MTDAIYNRIWFIDEVQNATARMIIMLKHFLRYRRFVDSFDGRNNTFSMIAKKQKR